MLQNLSIQNYALIKELQVDFDRGLSVITGETGAGKSILLGALGLVLGNRADKQALSDENHKCIVEAEFKIDQYGLKQLFEDHDLDYEPNTSFRREITPSGKSRAFINDTPVNLNTLKTIGSKLINIHSQHEILTLNNRDFQLAVLDTVAETDKLFFDYRTLWREYSNCMIALDHLIAEETKFTVDHDYNQFLFDELDRTNPTDGEINTLEEERMLLANAEEVKLNLHSIVQLFEGENDDLLSSLKHQINILDRFKSSDKELTELFERYNSIWIELNDLSCETLQKADLVNHNPERLGEITQRIDLINHLLHKHKVNSISGLTEIRDSLDKKLQEEGSLSSRIESKEKELAALSSRLLEQALNLTGQREKAISHLAEHIHSVIAQLGMPDATFTVELEKLPMPGPDGIDKIRFLFNANKGGKPDEIKKVASGGELSRLMLAVKSVLATKKLLPSIIFDEIDSGVSGEIAVKTGRILNEMASNMQVIVITHLPQIAAKGNKHFVAIKENDGKQTQSKVVEVCNDERVIEIAGMLSDGSPTDAALETARQLMNL